MINRTRIITALFGAFLAISISGCKFTTDKDSNVNLGMSAIEEENYSDALSLFDSAIENEEELKHSYRGQGIAYMGLGMYSDAIESFENALSCSNGIVTNEDVDVSYYLAMAEYKNSQPEASYDTYSAIIDLNKKAYKAYYLRGKLSLLQGQLDSAIEDYDKAVAINDDDFDLYISIYRDLADEGYEARGEEYISRVTENISRLNDYQCGLLNYYTGQYDEAKNYLEKARTKNESADLVMYLGKCYESLGDTNYATSIYQGYIDEHPDEALIYNELGLMYIKSCEYSNALSAFQSGRNLNDTAYNQSLMFNEIVAYEYLTEYKKAAVLMKEYLELYPTDEVAQREYIFLSTR